MNKFVIATLAVGLLSANAYADNQTQTINQNSNQQPSVSQGQGQSMQSKNKTVSEGFLEANKKKPGVVTLPSGLQYKVINEGNGAAPSDSDVVTVNYTGWLVNGTEFDSSYKRGEPASFPVNGVIPGWVEALKMMKPGATWELYIPSTLAYGEQGAPPIIGPNEALVFKVNLISVKKS